MLSAPLQLTPDTAASWSFPLAVVHWQELRQSIKETFAASELWKVTPPAWLKALAKQMEQDATDAGKQFLRAAVSSEATVNIFFVSIHLSSSVRSY